MKHELVPAVVKGQEERYSLDVVPMKVGEKKRGLDRLLAEFILQALAQPPHPAAAIEDDQRAVGQANFQATGVAPIAGVARLRSGHGASYAPKSNLHSAPLRSTRVVPCTGQSNIPKGEFESFGFKRQSLRL